ncbi:NADPH-dependent FMN reductase [Phycicoccus sp. Soil803]|uniref:NADPH-dependent FMN reductase n=1 Tax=Phycicoccus sp. Soil803 TaxID=1736415 RepID=UPI000710B4B2|nr:NADPH-dependent FMN reductase [Phycicoccus sp. Soil803]KRF23563.1 NADPH-dependent FMN reductase [Phycicoccus sp. Soil803]
MAVIATISSSPNRTSKTDAVLTDIARQLQRAGHVVVPVVLRDLPAEPLLRGNAHDPDIARAVAALEAADAVVVSTPVYKAAYGGLLKTFLDLLPQFALRGKVVLPVATGGTPAHVLVVDYALRPVLASLAPSSITPGWFVLADHVTLVEGGEVLIDEVAHRPLREVTAVFLDTVAGRSLVAAGAEPREAVA